MGYIYKIINTVNNKIYIGKTEETIERRLYEHKLNVKTGHKRSRLYSAMKHYGVDKFIAEELDHSDSSEELCEKERYWIKTLNSQDPEVGYNIAPGGEGGFTWSAKGYVTMNKDNKNTFVKPEDVNDYLEKGWNLGCKKLKLDSKEVESSAGDSRQRTTLSRRRGLWINNGERQIRVLSDELQTYLDNGWVRGYCKKAQENLSRAHQGQVPGNKGKTLSEEERKHVSEKTKEAMNTPEMKAKMRAIYDDRKGSKWVTNGEHSLLVHKNEVEYYINSGYKLGRMLRKVGDVNE